MAQIIIEVCNVCGVDEEVRATPGPPIATTAGARCADLCPKHKDMPIGPNVALVEREGRPWVPPKKAVTPVKAPTPATTQDPTLFVTDDDDRARKWACRYPNCAKTESGVTMGKNGPIANAQGRSAHERAMHGGNHE